MRIIKSLAKIEDVKDFRVREFMKEVGMDPSQPSLLYRQLIREAREAAQLDLELSRLRQQNQRLRERNRVLSQELVEERGGRERAVKEACARSERAAKAAGSESESLRQELEERAKQVEELEAENKELTSSLSELESKYRGICDFLSNANESSWWRVIRRVIEDICQARADEDTAQWLERVYGHVPAYYEAKSVKERLNPKLLTLLRARLREDLRAALEIAPSEHAELRRRLDNLLVFENIPCSVCGRPMSPSREQVLEIFGNWHHTYCKSNVAPRIIYVKQ